ncbi:hypothetical protein VNO77_09826 [Canavalia gladiata]|uniref:Protein CPR-5 n=1 Tax=Canavalia gladiata TaxID=3824 RepID=A0AAN9M9K4_CANGL
MIEKYIDPEEEKVQCKVSPRFGVVSCQISWTLGLFIESTTEGEKGTHMAESEYCPSEPDAEPINRCKKSKALMNNRKESKEASETTSSCTSRKGKYKGKGISCKRRNPRVLARRNRANVDTIGLPLGMSFAAIIAQVLYRRDTSAQSMSPGHLSMMCTLAVKESLTSVFGDKLDGLTRNFEQSFSSTLSTLQLLYESSKGSEGSKFNNMKMGIRGSKLSLYKGECSSDTVVGDGHSGSPSQVEIQERSICPEEVRDNFHMDSASHDLTLHWQPNQLVSFSQNSGSGIKNPMISTFEKSIVEQCRSNDLKTVALGLKMKKLKLKETELGLNFDLNDLKRLEIAMGESKASFEAEKFKSELEDTRHGELKKKCIDCLIAGLLIMSFSLLYGAYVYSYERITEATESCTPSSQESSSWWAPKSLFSFNFRLHVLWCQVQVMSRMAFGILMIFAVAYLLMQRSTTSSQTMPVTFILLMLGIGCGYCGKLCIDTLGGSGNMWLLYWEILCLLHFLSIGWTSALHIVLHGPVDALPTTKENTIFRYWIRRFLFYATLLVFLPLICGLMPFASLGQWKDHFMLKVSDFSGSEL